jgi:hypothetical protein
MGLYGIVGKPEDEYVHKIGALEGNGKTLTMVDFLQRDYLKTGCKVYTNFKTYIKNSEQKTFKQMVMMFKDRTLQNCSVGIDELGTNLNSLGEDKIRMSFYTFLLNQARKGNVKIYYTQQNQMDLIKKVRTRTNPTFIPEKFHTSDHSMCINPLCKRQHYVKIFIVKPVFKYLYSIKCDVVGKLYDTNEFIDREELSDDEIMEFIEGEPA